MAGDDLLQRRLQRERSARKQAETIAELKTRQLFDANLELERFNAALETRVREATAEVLDKNELLERRVRELAALHGVTTALNSVMQIDVLLERIIDLSREVMGAEAASLLLLDPESGELRFHVARGEAAGAIKPLTVEVGRGIAGTVARSGEPLLVPDAYQDPRFDASFDRRSGFRTLSVLAVPIKIKDEVMGVVEVINKVGGHAFDEEDLSLFRAFASGAGVALENARLFEQTRAMAEDLREALEAERRLSIEKEKMGAYIPRHVVDEISRNREQKLALGGKNVWATVLFSDIKGFTKLSETLEPQRLVALLNEYMTAMTRIIEKNGGVVDKFIGDGIMAIFTATDETDNHALRAVRSGIAMQRKLQALRKGWAASRPEAGSLQMRVGINTGDMVAGNIGSETRMEYTVVGDNVNVASRLESVCRPDGIFISGTCHRALDGLVPAEPMEPLHVKNRVQPVETYSVRIED